MLQRTYLTGLAIALLAAQACGSDDGKKKAQRDTDAGMAGQAGSPEVNAGGSSAGSPGEVIEGGTAGAPPEVTGGMGGTPEVEVTGGAGGQPSPPPEPELLFTVKGQGGTPGLPGTAVNSAAHPQNAIYTSSTGSQDRVNGTNEVKVAGIDLGLAETDPIVAFALVQPEPAKPLFLFSVTDGTEGADQSRVDRSYHSAFEGYDEQANLYYSEGTQSTRYLGEGGDEYGYNAMLATEASLGLAGGEPDGPYPDDLIGLAVHDKRLPLGDIYFTVASYAAGALDSAVATVPANERACTVFKSAGDGTNSVAFSCTDLGLIPDDVIDGLAVWGDGAPTQVIFSVNTSSQGTEGSAVETVALTVPGAGATLFSSAGDGSNAVLKSDRDLGLGERYPGEYDDIDGFTVIDAPAKGNVAHAASCALAYDPYVDGGFSALRGVIHVGSNVLVLFGQTSTQANKLLAYNATSCAFLQEKDMPVGFEEPRTMAIVPLAGWSPAKPFDNVEYLGVTNANTGIEKAITRYDAAGAFVASFPIVDSYYGWNVSALVHEPVADRLYMLVDSYRYASLFVMPRPSAADTDLDATYRDLTTPCANEAGITGTDAAGNLYLTKLQASGSDFRVCRFTPGAELLPLPYSWSAEEITSTPYGFVAPNGSHFVLHEGDGTITIERGAFQAP